MDRFFAVTTCDRCGSSLKDGRIMSRFDESCLCIPCSNEEKLDKDYKKAVEAEHEQIKQGNFNYPGIRGGLKK